MFMSGQDLLDLVWISNLRPHESWVISLPLCQPCCQKHTMLVSMQSIQNRTGSRKNNSLIVMINKFKFYTWMRTDDTTDNVCCNKSGTLLTDPTRWICCSLDFNGFTSPLTIQVDLNITTSDDNTGLFKNMDSIWLACI